MKLSRKFLCFSLVFSMLLTSCSTGRNFSGGEKISIAYAEPISDFSPTSYDSNNKKYLSNIYETLVHYDKTFNYETGLATSWGRYDDLTWEFRLREDVLFHNGETFDADDALDSLEAAMVAENSQLSSLLSNFEKIEKIDAYKIRIYTKKPDPLLLNKLINVYIFPSGYEDFKNPLGTGPYFLKSVDGVDLNLERFERYWGPAPFFKNVTLTSIVDPEERLQAILSNKVQVLANVPPQFVDTLKEQNIKVSAFPSLEVSYLMFNFSGVFEDKNLREAVNAALGTDYAEKFGAGYLRPTSQFAALGIFGYSKTFADRSQNIEMALEYRNLHEGEVNVTLDIPIGLEELGGQIKENLADVNIIVTVNALAADEFENKILQGQSDLYFFGWKYDLADVSDFFETVIHGQEGNFGKFNGMNYADSQVDEYIEDASEILDSAQRRNVIQLITKEILDERVGVPLFEAEVLYGLRPELLWEIRLDGLILASEIVGKGV